LAAAVTTNLRLGDAPGNIIVHPEDSELAEVSVINVSQLVTLNKEDLETRVGQLPQSVMSLVDDGLRLILDLA
jgi:mRNA interferase MazF